MSSQPTQGRITRTRARAIRELEEQREKQRTLRRSIEVLRLVFQSSGGTSISAEEIYRDAFGSTSLSDPLTPVSSTESLSLPPPIPSPIPQPSSIKMSTQGAMPTRGTSKAPHFSPDKLREICRYFQDLDNLFKTCNITADTAKKQYTCHYVTIDPSDLWSSISAFGATVSWNDFVKAVCKLYPGTDDEQKWTIADMNTLVGSQLRIGIYDKIKIHYFQLFAVQKARIFFFFFLEKVILQQYCYNSVSFDRMVLIFGAFNSPCKSAGHHLFRFLN